MSYENVVRKELADWQRKMRSKPTILNRWSKKMQDKINSYIPEKIHKAITAAIKQMIRGVLFGAGYVAKPMPGDLSLAEREAAIEKLIEKYKKTAAAEGGITGAGGILLGLADFPILLGIKLKMLYDIATLYGYDLKDYRERIYVLHIFQLAFSSQDHRMEVYKLIENWDKKTLPADIHDFDWRSFQQEYRDYIDLAKMAQLIPGIGAVVGVIVNYQLIKQLGTTAKNAYRMRILEESVE